MGDIGWGCWPGDYWPDTNDYGVMSQFLKYKYNNITVKFNMSSKQ